MTRRYSSQPIKVRVRRDVKGLDSLLRPGSLAFVFCLLDGDPMTLTAVGLRLGVTRNTLLYHLRHLEKARVVGIERKREIFVHLLDAAVVLAWISSHHPKGFRNGKVTPALWARVTEQLHRNRRQARPPQDDEA